MSYPIWPLELQQVPLVDGFDSSGQNPVHRQEMESGLARVTLISSTAVRTNNYSIICTEQQLAVFWSFYNTDAAQGADMVYIPMITGNKPIPHLCRFVGYPKQIPDGLEWRVTFQLETDEQQIDWSL